MAKVAETYGVNLAEGVLSHQMKRYVIDGNQVIIQKPTPDQQVDEFEFKENEVYGLDIVMTTGSGKFRETSIKPTVYKRETEQQYSLRSNAARAVLKEVSTTFQNLPFTVR